MLAFLSTVFLALNAAAADILAGTGGLPALASFLAVALVIVVATRRVRGDILTSPVHIRAVALLERSRRTAFLRLRDPDAPGRSRPRAPGN